MINIVPKFTDADIKKMMADRANRIRLAIISRMQFVGERFIAYARDNGEYKDRTGNLRSSVGYVILENGKQIKSSFPGNTSEGKANAKKVISEVKGKFTQGIVLIVVAGMEYAASVEARGLDVLTASSQIAVSDLKKAFRDLTKKIEAMK